MLEEPKGKVLVEESRYYHKLTPRVYQPTEKLNPHDPVAVDLFSGIGGLSIGLEMAGFQIALGLDIHKPSIETFRKSHSKAAAILGDIQRILKINKPNDDSLLCQVLKDVLGHRELDLLVAGIPCQGFSLANKKRSIIDKRNYLFMYFFEAAKVLNPKYILIENVTGLTTLNKGSFVEDIKMAMEEEGYEAEHEFLNAADFGVPQKRKRIIFWGSREGRYPIFWPTPTFGMKSRPYRTVEDAISDLPPLKAGGISREYRRVQELTKYQKLMKGNCNRLFNHEAPDHPRSVIEKIRNTRPGEPIYERYKQRIRLAWNEQSPTQVAGGIRPQYQFGHPDQERGLTVRERARIQSIPDRVRIFGGVVQGRVQTGNAVPPLLAKALGERIRMGLFKDEFVQVLMKWSGANLRKFPWRREGTSPYEVLISEMLLRKTRAESVVDTYLEFIRMYSTPALLAKANPEKLQGTIKSLGLSSIRTKALINLGWELSRKHFGNVPRDPYALQSIPHVGRYVANATLLFGHNIRKPIVDVNVQRLLYRVFNVEQAVEIHKADYLWDIVDTMMPNEDFKEFAWSLVDFPAAICTPRSPKCNICPLHLYCKYFQDKGF